MQLTLLDSGATYLARAQQNRQRLTISHLALGGSINYTPATSATAFQAPALYKARIDSQDVSGDSVTITCILPATTALSFGEIAVLTPEGGFFAMAVLTTAIVKTLGSQMTLTLQLSASGLGAQMTFVNSKVSLSRVRPDFDDILLQLQSAAAEKQSWSGLVTNETGTTLLELMAGIGEFDAYMFESAVQENFPDTAKLDSSQYAIQNMLSNRLTRKNPAGADVTLTRVISSAAKIIPAYTPWAANGKILFNRTAISFIAGQTSQTCRLYEGVVNSISVTGIGQDYQFWVSTEDQFTVSDLDVMVSVSGVQIPVVQNSLWNYPSAPAVQDRTDKNGRLSLSFGNATLGTRPAVTDTVTVVYVVTSGVTGNDSSFSAAPVTCPSDANVTGIASSSLTGGGDEPAITLYQRMGGDLFGGQKGAVTPSQYRARARQYPGVLDAVVLAQRDLAPYNKDWFNVGKVVLLTQTPWVQADRDAYELWYRQRTMYSMRYQVLTGDAGTEPRQKPVNVRAAISCRNDADLVSIQAQAEGAVRKLFVPRAGILSRSVYLTDILNAINSIAPELIDYTVLGAPATDIGMDIYTPPTVNVTVLPGVGTLPPGNYVFGVASKDADGQTVPNQISVTLTASVSKVVLSWDLVPAATSYLIYGRTLPYGQLAEIATSATPTYTDDGTGTGTGQPPAIINTSGVHYPVLGTLDITASYSRRRRTEDTGFSQ